jgi:Flp pilus assembly pilin Flp
MLKRICGPSAISVVRKLALGTSGATSIEYAMIAFFVSILIVAAVSNIGGTVQGFFASVVAAV